MLAIHPAFVTHWTAALRLHGKSQTGIDWAGEVMGMRYYDITFRSVTYAQQGERLLKGSGFRCALQRTPRWMEEQGCGYALKIRVSEIEAAMALLAGRQIPIRRVYEQKADGVLEEVSHDLS